MINDEKGGARVRITSTPGAHGPGFLAKVLPDVMGSLLEFENPRGGSAFRIYITGDTLLFDELKEIPRRFPDIDLALLHLGGTMFFGLLLVTMAANLSSGAGWKEVMPRKAVLPAPSATTAGSAMLFRWNRIPAPLFSFYFLLA